jgi:hypothetical protein
MIEFKRDPRFFRAVIRREKEDEDPAFSYFMMEDTFTNIKDKYDISRIEKFQITRKNYVVFGLITDLENITEDDLISETKCTINSSYIHSLYFKEHQYIEKDDLKEITIKISAEFIGDLMFSANDYVNEYHWEICLRDEKIFRDNEDIIRTILKSELNYGRKRKKSITDNRPTV